jgi:sensor histidine kinase YesM
LKHLNAFVYSKKWGIRILRHLVFWTVDIVSYLGIVSNNDLTVNEVFAVLLRTIPLALATYFVLYYLIPNFSKHNDYAKLILGILVVLAVIGVGLRYFNFYVVSPLLNIELGTNYVVLDKPSVIRNIFSCMSVICMAATIKLIKNKTDLLQRNEMLVAEKKEAELSFLKAQMHPHFLFNTLNTLYSETMQHSEKAEQVVLHFSSLLRFILEECNKPAIRLGNELKVIQDYIEIEKLRHGARLDVNLSVERIDPETEISPLLFLPFVENSFKHSLSSIRGKISISISIHQQKGKIRLTVENDTDKQISTHHATSGRGIANIRRQLELLYDKNYSLTIEEASNKFKVALLIPEVITT